MKQTPFHRYDVVVEVTHRTSGISPEDAKAQAEYDGNDMIDRWYTQPEFRQDKVRAVSARKVR